MIKRLAYIVIFGCLFWHFGLLVVKTVVSFAPVALSPNVITICGYALVAPALWISWRLVREHDHTKRRKLI